MDRVKVAVVFYSTYGTNHGMAELAAEAARAAGADVRLRRTRETAPEDVVQSQEKWAEQAERMADVPEASPDDLVWADGYIFITPTRYGGAASQMRAFIDTLGPIWSEGKLANKCVTAMTSAANVHGGQETTLQTLYTTFMHWGSIIITPGYTDDRVAAAGGNPYGMSVEAGELSDEEQAGIRFQAERLVEMTRTFLAGRRALEQQSQRSQPQREERDQQQWRRSTRERVGER